jgi:hypothetical protein
MSAEDTIDKPKPTAETAEAVEAAIEAPEAPQPASEGKSFAHESAEGEASDAEQLAAVRGRLAEGQEHLEQVGVSEESVPQEAIARAEEEIGYLNKSYANKEEFVQDMKDSIEGESDLLKEKANMTGAGTFVTSSTIGMVGATFLGLGAPVALGAMPAVGALLGLGVWGYKRISGRRRVRGMRDAAAKIANSF